MFYCAHPPIYDLLDKLNTIQTRSYIKIRALNTPSVPVLHKKDKEKLEYFRNTREQYDSGQITRKEYVRKMSYKAQPVLRI